MFEEAMEEAESRKDESTSDLDSEVGRKKRRGWKKSVRKYNWEEKVIN